MCMYVYVVYCMGINFQGVQIFVDFVSAFTKIEKNLDICVLCLIFRD